MRNKMSIETKMKLIYSGELLVIAILALVLGILKITGILETRPTRLLIYNIISFVGGAYILFDLVWVIVSKKHREKSCIMDKIIALPAGIYLFVFDIICFIDKANGVVTNDDFVKYSIGAVLIFIAVIYIFEAIYHYKHPTPQVIEMINEANDQLQEIENSNNALENIESSDSNLEIENKEENQEM